MQSTKTHYYKQKFEESIGSESRPSPYIERTLVDVTIDLQNFLSREDLSRADNTVVVHHLPKKQSINMSLNYQTIGNGLLITNTSQVNTLEIGTIKTTHGKLLFCDSSADNVNATLNIRMIGDGDFNHTLKLATTREQQPQFHR